MIRRCLTLAGMVAAVSAVSTAAHAQPKLVVHGDATCPSAEMIRAALLAARPDGEWPEQTVAVEVANDRLFLSLGAGRAVRRELPADRDCAVRAQSLAVVIAAWSGELAAHPIDSPALTAPSTDSSVSPAASFDPPALTAASPAPVPAPTKKPSHVIELDGAAFYSPLWGHAPGVWLGVGRTPRDGGFGVRALGGYQSARDVALEGGSNQVLRFLVGAALTYQLQRKYVFAVGDVGLVGTLTRARGTGYEPNQTDTTANLGGVADLRGGVRLGRYSLWLNARGMRLVHSEAVKVQSTSPGVADSAALNAWDLHFGVGLGVRFE